MSKGKCYLSQIEVHGLWSLGECSPECKRTFPVILDFSLHSKVLLSPPSILGFSSFLQPISLHFWFLYKPYEGLLHFGFGVKYRHPLLVCLYFILVLWSS